jgi:hypothetical protein
MQPPSRFPAIKTSPTPAYTSQQLRHTSTPNGNTARERYFADISPHRSYLAIDIGRINHQPRVDLSPIRLPTRVLVVATTTTTTCLF